MRISIQHPPSVKTSLGEGKRERKRKWEKRKERKREKKEGDKKKRKKERDRNNINMTQTEGNLTACLIQIMPITYDIFYVFMNDIVLSMPLLQLSICQLNCSVTSMYVKANFYSHSSHCVHCNWTQRKYTVKHNTSMPYNNVPHVLVRHLYYKFEKT